MEKELLFAGVLEAVKEAAKNQGNVITKEEIDQAFCELSLSSEQMDMIYDYLKKNKIGIEAPLNADDFLTQEDADYLEVYLEEISALEMAAGGEIEAVTLSAMAGDHTARAKLIEIYLPQVVDLAKLYAGQGTFLEDLIGEGNVALAMGVDMLGCLDEPEEVQGMLGRMMMEAMEECIARDSASGDADKKAEEEVNRVFSLAKELSESLLRKVTVEELALETELNEEQIREAMRLSGGKIEEIEDTAYEGL